MRGDFNLDPGPVLDILRKEGLKPVHFRIAEGSLTGCEIEIVARKPLRQVRHDFGVDRVDLVKLLEPRFLLAPQLCLLVRGCQIGFAAIGIFDHNRACVFTGHSWRQQRDPFLGRRAPCQCKSAPQRNQSKCSLHYSSTSITNVVPRTPSVDVGVLNFMRPERESSPESTPTLPLSIRIEDSPVRRARSNR